MCGRSVSLQRDRGARIKLRSVLAKIPLHVAQRQYRRHGSRPAVLRDAIGAGETKSRSERYAQSRAEGEDRRADYCTLFDSTYLGTLRGMRGPSGSVVRTSVKLMAGRRDHQSVRNEGCACVRAGACSGGEGVEDRFGDWWSR